MELYCSDWHCFADTQVSIFFFAFSLQEEPGEFTSCETALVFGIWGKMASEKKFLLYFPRIRQNNLGWQGLKKTIRLNLLPTQKADSFNIRSGCSGLVRFSFEYLHGWRYHRLSGLMFDHSHHEVFFLISIGIALMQLGSIASHPLTRHL